MKATKEKKLAPIIRHKSFKDDWSQVLYGEIFKFHPTNSLSRAKLNYESGSIKNIHYGDIHTKFNSLLDASSEVIPFINDDVDISKIKKESYCQIGDFVIADASEDYNDIGKSIEIVNMGNQRLVAGLHTFLARPNKNKVVLGFSSFLLQSWHVRKQIMTIAQGTKVLSLSTSRLSGVKLIIPSLPEQQKIASFLSKVDEKIAHLSKKKELLEEYKKGVTQKIFKQEIRFKILNENGELVEPPKWEKRKLKDLAIRVTEKNTKNEYKLVLTNSAIKGIVSQLDYFDKDIANQNNLKGYYIVQKDDFVYNPRVSIHAPVGPIKRNKLSTGVMSPLYSVFRFKIDNLEFFEYYFETVYWHKYLRSVANIGARHDRMNILNDDFLKMPIPFPCEKERKKMSQFLSSIDKKLNAVDQQLSLAKEWKKGLLQKMFV